MKMLIWKELRENARWAALASVVLVLAEIYALSTHRSGPFQDYKGITLCENTFLLVSALGCAIVGAGLGAVQILPELRRDQWASLLHRPISRGMIFAGKAVSGLFLYLLATGLPLLISIAYVAMPGQFPVPFVPGLALPAASDIVLGAAMYFIALLLGLQSGSWLALRGAIVLSAVGLVVFHIGSSSPFPFLVPIVAGAFIALAGWGAMLGPVGSRPLMPRMALGLIVLLGVQTAVLLVGGILQFLFPAIPSQMPPRFWISKEGVVFLETGDAKGRRLLTGTDGKPVTDPRYVGNQPVPSIITLPISWGHIDPLVLYSIFKFWEPRNSSGYIRSVTSYDYGSPEYWFLIPGPRPYFIGYDRLSKRPIGICDASGFQQSHASLDPFPRRVGIGGWNYASPQLYWTGHDLFGVDFGNRQILRLGNMGSEMIYGAVGMPVSSYGSKSKYVAVALDSGIRIYDLQGTLLCTVPYGQRPTQSLFISIGCTDDLSRIFVNYHQDSFSGDIFKEESESLDVFDGHGQPLQAYQAPIPSQPTPVSWSTRFCDLLFPPFPSLIGTMWMRPHQADYSVAMLMAFPGLRFDLADSELPPLAYAALALAALALLWGWRSGLSAPRLAIWALLSLCFGIAGFLAYRLATDWPVRVPCPECRRKRPVRQHSCPHCQKDWPAPAATGAEIVEAT